MDMSACPRLSPEERARLETLEETIDYAFDDADLLRRALTHASSTSLRHCDNERLEFFGDAILDLVVSEYLFRHSPSSREGELTEMKSAVVCTRTLALAANRLGVRPYLFLGRGISTREELPLSLYANTFEALVAAIYLDGGFDAARGFILAQLAEELAEVREEPPNRNYKSLLQEWMQRDGRAIPHYEVADESGPDHAKEFDVVAYEDEREIGRGRGRTKKAAEQAAARAALLACGAVESLDGDDTSEMPPETGGEDEGR